MTHSENENDHFDLDHFDQHFGDSGSPFCFTKLLSWQVNNTKTYWKPSEGWSQHGWNMWVEFSADIPNHRTAERWNARGALLPTHQDRVPLHRHEVQWRGTRQASAEMGRAGDGRCQNVRGTGEWHVPELFCKYVRSGLSVRATCNPSTSLCTSVFEPRWVRRLGVCMG